MLGLAPQLIFQLRAEVPLTASTSLTPPTYPQKRHTIDAPHLRKGRPLPSPHPSHLIFLPFSSPLFRQSYCNPFPSSGNHNANPSLLQSIILQSLPFFNQSYCNPFPSFDNHTAIPSLLQSIILQSLPPPSGNHTAIPSLFRQPYCNPFPSSGNHTAIPSLFRQSYCNPFSFSCNYTAIPSLGQVIIVQSLPSPLLLPPQKMNARFIPV